MILNISLAKCSEFDYGLLKSIAMFRLDNNKLTNKIHSHHVCSRYINTFSNCIRTYSKLKFCFYALKKIAYNNLKCIKFDRIGECLLLNNCLYFHWLISFSYYLTLTTR